MHFSLVIIVLYVTPKTTPSHHRFGITMVPQVWISPIELTKHALPLRVSAMKVITHFYLNISIERFEHERLVT